MEKGGDIEALVRKKIKKIPKVAVQRLSFEWNTGAIGGSGLPSAGFYVRNYFSLLVLTDYYPFTHI